MSLTSDGYAERITDTSGYFLPHFEVLRAEAETSKARIVYNASFGARSLNDVMWKGEIHNMDIIGHLARFREGSCVWIGYLSKAFLQISIDPEHRKYLCLYWKDKQNVEHILQMKRLPFGLACAPAILSAVLNDAMSNLPSCSDIFLHIYVDDLIVINNDLQTLTNRINDVNSRL